MRLNGDEACGLLASSEALQEACRNGRLSDIPDFLPPFLPNAVQGAPDGLLVVERVPATNLPGTFYDLVDREGKLEGVLALAPNQKIIGFSSTSVYVVTTDEFDLQWLTRHPWP